MPERLFLDIMRVEIRDHDGHRRLVPFLDVLGPPRGFANAPARRLLWRIRLGIIRRTILAGSIVAVLTIVLAIGASLTLIPWLSLGGSHRLLPVLPAMLAFLLVYDLVLLRLFRRLYRPAYTEAALACGLCPWCLYTLEGQPADQHGMLRCPECGGCWRESSLPPSIVERSEAPAARPDQPSADSPTQTP